MTKHRSVTTVIASISAALAATALVGYAWYWGTRPEQEIPDTPVILAARRRWIANADAFARASNEKRRRAFIAARMLKPLPAARIVSQPGKSAPAKRAFRMPYGVRAMDDYLRHGGTLESWRRQKLAGVLKVKADAKLLRNATDKESIADRLTNNYKLQSILQNERVIIIWQGINARNEEARQRYRQMLVAKDGEIASVVKQMDSDVATLERLHMFATET